jgi:hypothetical protein
MEGGIFVWIMVGVFVFLIVFVILLGLFYPGTGAEQLKWKPTRSPELEAQNEIDDLSQMLEATNAKRRARGAGDLDERQLHARLREDEALRQSLRSGEVDESAEEEMRQLREAREFRAARRRAREQDREDG